MSIASEITRLQGVKSNILQAIADKGVTVPVGSALDDCPSLIAAISGGGNYNIMQGQTLPTNNIGNNGDLYLLIETVDHINNDIPIQTNNDEIIVSDEWAGDQGYAWHLFDHNNGTYWSTRLNDNTNQYCGIDFGTPVVMKSCEIFPRIWNNSPQIKNFNIEGSNNSTDWDILYSGLIPNDPNSTSVKFSLNNNTPYRYYRLYVFDTWSSQTITVNEMYLSMSEELNQRLDHIFQKNNGVWELVI